MKIKIETTSATMSIDYTAIIVELQIHQIYVAAIQLSYSMLNGKTFLEVITTKEQAILIPICRAGSTDDVVKIVLAEIQAAKPLQVIIDNGLLKQK